VEIELEPLAQKDVRRFGLTKGFLLMALLRDLRDDENLAHRLRPLPSSGGTARFRIDLTATFVARVQVTARGLLVERVVTAEELDDTAADLFGED
jgi:hypothetical protein